MRLHVRLTGAVAAFTAGIFGLFLFAGDAFEVRVFVKAEPDVRVAGLANGTSDKGSGRCLGEHGRRHKCEQQYEFRGATHARSLWCRESECRAHLVKVL